MTATGAVAVIVLDSVGIGHAPDAAAFGDEGSATLQHVAEARRGLHLPNLGRLGLGRIADIVGVPPEADPRGAFGIMTQSSAGKDTTTGHWEIAGIVLERPFPTYPEGFPDDVIDEFRRRAGVDILSNDVASGTEVIARYGEEHMRTGRPIVYTSADSVFQIAAHVGVVPLERLYEMCRIARAILRGPHEVGRVIARPFDGPVGNFRRTQDRHDFSVLPPRSVLDELVEAGLPVHAVGKVADVFAGRGITASTPTRSNNEGVDATIAALRGMDRGLVFTNLVEFDQTFGHRNDPQGYGAALEEFDARMPEVLEALAVGDLVFVTADHGNDPTTPSTDHSRERVPVVAAGAVRPGVDLGIRNTFADLGATVAELLGVATSTGGMSFAADLIR